MCRNPLPMVLVLAAGCGGGVTLIDPPPPPPAGPTSLRLLPETEDVTAAQALGWETGIPDAEVTVTPVDSSAPPEVVQGNGNGIVDLSGLAGGVLYWVEVRRWLTPEEQGRLPATEDVLGWVTRTSVAAGSGESTVQVPASRRHGLVISEWSFNIAAPPPLHETYDVGGFVELYNNSDTTVFLDGLTIVEGLVVNYDNSSDGCAFLSPYAKDSRGIWTRNIEQFPGRGRDYPVAPGTPVVIAVDAIDHSVIVEGGLNLNNVDFEFPGGPDNPDVPNMVDTLSLGGSLTGHGPFFEYLGSVLVLARPYVKATAPRVILGGEKEWAMVSGDLFLDVFSTWSGYMGGVRCPQMINPLFDSSPFDRRMEGYDENVEFLHSISRLPVPAGVLGPTILQWTKNSAVDFHRTLRTPGLVP